MTESSHNLTGVKTILSVRAQRQHLFVLDKMTLTLILILFGTRSISTTPPTVRCSVPPPLTTVYNNFITKSPLVSLLSFLFVLTRSGRMEISVKEINSAPPNRHSKKSPARDQIFCRAKKQIQLRLRSDSQSLLFKKLSGLLNSFG